MAKRIMIVDDEEGIIETTRLRLEKNGYAVSSSSGVQALEDIRKAQPDLVLLDVMMPGVDGFSILQDLKRDPDLSRIPIVIFSGKPKEAMMELFGPEGVAGYITKPYDPQDFLSQIKRLVGE